VKNELYVDAAKVAGLPDRRIVARHVLYAVRAPIIIQAAFIAGTTIAIQAGLDFLGLGSANESSWGQMLEDAFSNLYLARIQLVWPGLALALTVSALVFLGNGLRDALEGPRGNARRGHGVERRRDAGGAPETDSGGAERTPSDRVLFVRDLTIAYPAGKDQLRQVVKHVSMDVRAGEVVGLVGESGSGKTQTAFSILGLLPDEAVVASGTVTIAGRRFARLTAKALRPVRGRVVAYVPQEPMSNLDPSFKVGKQLCYGIRAVEHISFKEAKDRVLELLGRVGLANPERVFDSYPHELSGGMAQRALIAGAVACRPKLLIADEPTTALDVTVQAEILELLRDLRNEQQMGVLLATHNFGVVADLCDRVAVMHDGSIVEQGEVQQIFANPAHKYTKMLLDAILSEDVVRSELIGTGGETA
jgi:peptide/nickel transport system permease protein